MSNALPKVTLELDTERENITFSLYRTINILSDISGKGKTNMVSKLIRVLNTKRESIKAYGYSQGQKLNYRVSIATTVDNLPSDSLSDNCTLFILDDLKAIYFDESVLSLYKTAKKAVFLFISRGGQEGYNSYTASSDAVYRLNYSKKGKKEFFSISKCIDDLMNVSDNRFKPATFSSCICEGKKGYAEDKFYSQFFKFVNCAEGRNNVAKKMLKLNFQDNLCVMVDLCGFGDCIEEFISALKEMQVEVILVDIPPFEYLMLKTVFPDTQVESKDLDYVDGKTYESYVSSVLFSKRCGLCNPFNKERVPVCLTVGCIGCNKYKISKCFMYTSTVKERILDMCSKSSELLKMIKFSNPGGIVYAEDIGRLCEKIK